MRSRHGWSCLAALAVVTGCSTTGSGTGAPPGPGAPQPPARTAEVRGPEVPSGPVAGLDLGQALALAGRIHPTLAELEAQVEEARGRAEQAGLFPNPDAVYRMESAPFEGKTTREAEHVAGATFHVPLWTRLSSAERAGLLDAQRLERELAARRLEIGRDVRTAFAAALHLSKVVEVRGSAVEAARSAADLTRGRVAAGDALPQDAGRAEMEAIRAETDLSESRSRLREALVELAVRIGSSGLSIESVSGDVEAAIDLPALEALAAAIDRSPAMEAARAGTAVEEARLEVARDERIPDVDLDLFYRRRGADESDTFDVGVKIPLPAFDRNQGEIRAAHAAVRAAQARERRVAEELAGRLSNAHARLAGALERSRVFRQDLLPRSKSVLDAAETRYRAGDMTLAEILPIRRERFSIEIDYLEALREVLAARAELSPFLDAPTP